jgi:hypothetical protein
MISVNIPMNDKTADFLSMDETAKCRVIELGTVFLARGDDAVQMWNATEWEAKFAEKDRLHRDNIELMKNGTAALRTTIDRLSNEIDTIAQEKNDAVRRVAETTKVQYEMTINRLTDEIRTIQQRSTDRDDEVRAIERATMNDIFNTQIVGIRNDTGRRIAELQASEAAIQAKYDTIAHREQNSSAKGRDSESFVFEHLNRMFPAAEVEDTHTTPARGDFIIRDNGLCMMVETKNYTTNVGKTEIDKFYRDMDLPANEDIQCGVFVSVRSGIAKKQDFEFEMRGGKPIIFLHNVETTMDNIRIGMNFFRMVLAQTDVDFGDKEIVTKLSGLMAVIRKESKKTKAVLDKYHAAQTKQFDDMGVIWEEMFKLLCLS